MDGTFTKGNKKRKRSNLTYGGAASEGSDSEEPDLDVDLHNQVPEPNSGLTRETAVVVVDNGFSTSTSDPTPAAAPISLGGALRRNADGSVAAPRVTKRRANKNVGIVHKTLTFSDFTAH